VAVAEVEVEGAAAARQVEQHLLRAMAAVGADQAAALSLGRSTSIFLARAYTELRLVQVEQAGPVARAEQARQVHQAELQATRV